MLILNQICSKKHKFRRHVAMVFGMGLLGSSIVDGLKRRESFAEQILPYSWNDPEARAQQNKSILNAIVDITNAWKTSDATKLKGQISILWSAGKGGFEMNTADAAAELEAFLDVIDLVKDVQGILQNHSVFFHMLSSAGGIYEGLNNISPDTPPQPLRPYGFLKLEQEKYAVELNDFNVSVVIYRLSSVYGYAGNHARLGLVPTLIRNGRHMKVTRIYGRIDTLRDYVLASDIGQFVASSILEPTHGRILYTLASGKPSMVFEILRSVESLLKRRLYLQFIATDINAAHNSYSKDVLPKTWKPTDLQTGIRYTFLKMVETH